MIVSSLGIFVNNDSRSYDTSCSSIEDNKGNTINGDLHCSKKISSDFHKDIPLIKEKFVKADYPLCFINIIVNEFQNLSYSLKHPTIN